MRIDYCLSGTLLLEMRHVEDREGLVGMQVSSLMGRLFTGGSRAFLSVLELLYRGFYGGELLMEWGEGRPSVPHKDDIVLAMGPGSRQLGDGNQPPHGRLQSSADKTERAERGAQRQTHRALKDYIISKSDISLLPDLREIHPIWLD